MNAIPIPQRRCPILAPCLILLALGLALAGHPARGQEQTTPPAVLEQLAAPTPPGDPGAPAAAPPKIAFDSLSFNAGTVEKGEKVTHTFTFRNEGESELVILSAKAG